MKGADMYESPVNVMEIQEPIIKQFIKEREEMVLEQIWNIGIDVNKEELIKALQYDREQYSKGYSDGYAKGIDDLVNGLLNWKSQDEEYKSFSDVCNEIAEQLKGGVE